jgi:hypothetical protein
MGFPNQKLEISQTYQPVVERLKTQKDNHPYYVKNKIQTFPSSLFLT